MRYMEYVRGSLIPTNPVAVDVWSISAAEDALGSAGIKSLLAGRGINTQGVVEFQDCHRSAGIGFVQDFKHRLQAFINDPEVEELGLEGEILVVSDYLKTAPEIYTIFVKNGQVTYKESHVLWELEEKRF